MPRQQHASTRSLPPSAASAAQDIPVDKARSQVDQYQQQYKDALAKAKLQAKQAADATATTVSRGALFGALALMLGALAAFVAGKLSAVDLTMTGSRPRSDKPRHPRGLTVGHRLPFHPDI